MVERGDSMGAILTPHLAFAIEADEVVLELR
jgi:hypothetical protein